MTGIICINKPQEFTSFDVVAIMRRCFHTKKVGHGGTLDPMATGVLPVLVGGATKAVDMLPESGKSYRAGFRLGYTSDTQDIWGALVQKSNSPLEEENLRGILGRFRGDIMQLPPMYSALKVNGQKLCDLARRGVEVERQPRPITISRLELVSFDGTDGILEVECSAGTYIRTLINDIGEAAGRGAVMTSLCRTCSHGFTLAQCHTIDEVRGADEQTLSDWLISVESAFECYPTAELDEVQRRMYLNGVRLDANRLSPKVPAGQPLRVRHGTEFLGIAQVNAEAELVSLKRFTQD